MSIVGLETIRVIEPGKQINLNEYRERLAGRLSENTFGTYFHPDERENPYPGNHTIGIDRSSQWKDQAMRNFALSKLSQANFVPDMQDFVSKFILAFEQLPLDSEGEIRLNAARKHEKMHELQAIRYKEIYQALRTEKILEQLEHTSWQRSLHKASLRVMGEIDHGLLHLGALTEAQAMAAEVKTPGTLNTLTINAYFMAKQVLTGFKIDQEQDAFGVLVELLSQPQTLLEESGIESIHYAMGATILLLPDPYVWQKLARKEIDYPDIRLEIAKALEVFLTNPQVMIQAINTPTFQIALDQALIASTRQYDQVLRAAETFLANSQS